MKRCNVCGENKLLNEFYNNTTTRDGLRYDCKDCNKIARAIYVKNNLEKCRASVRKSIRKRLKNDMDYREATNKRLRGMGQKWKKHNPDKVAIQRKLQRAVKNGDIERLPCEICGELESHGHHEDYSKPLDVNWLCRSHHVKVHLGSLSL